MSVTSIPDRVLVDDGVDVDEGVAAVPEHRPPSPKATAVLGLTVALLRLVYSWQHDAVTIAPDEFANLGAARWFAGGSWNMFSAATWQPGLGLLLTPFAWFTDDPDVLIRLALVLNACLGGLAAVALSRLVRRFGVFGDRSSLLVAGALALAPAALSGSAYVWPEPAIMLIAVVVVLLLHDLVRTGSARYGVGAVVLALAGASLHGRLGPLLLSAVVVVTVVEYRRGRTSAALPAWLGSVVGYAALTWLVGRYHTAVWEVPGSGNSIGSTLERLLDPVEVVQAGIGQVWYLLASTLGLFGVGVHALVSWARRHGVASLSAVCLVVFVPLFGLSVVRMAGPDRLDNLVYGRYNDAVVLPLLAAGVAWVALALREGRPREVVRVWCASVAVMLGLGLPVELGLESADASREALWAMIPGVVPWSIGSELSAVLISLFVLPAAAAAVGLCTTRLNRLAVPVAALALAAFGLNSWARTDQQTSVFQLDETQRREIAEVVGDEPLGLRLTPAGIPSGVSRLVQLSIGISVEWYLPDIEMMLEYGSSDGGGQLVLAPLDDILFRRGGGEVVYVLDDTYMAIWREAD